MPSEVPEGWSRRQIGAFLRESKLEGSDGVSAEKLTVKLYGKGVIAKVERGTGSENTKYFRRRGGQLIYSRLDFLNGAFGLIPEELDGRESTADLPAFDILETADARWLLAYVTQPTFYERQRSSAIGSRKARRVAPSEFLRMEVPVPPLPEQKKIAAILSSVDEAIRETQAVIDQTRRVKEGLLQELLTRGIGPDGKPHTRFKQTEIGAVPEGWDVLHVSDLLADVDPAMRSGPFGSALLKEELVNEGIPLLGIDNVHVERFVPDYRRFVSEEKFEQLRRYAVRGGDVMITIMGTVGRCCVVPDDIGRALSSKHTWTLTFDSQRYRPYLACAQINHARWVKVRFEADQQGGTMAAIRSETLRGLPLPVPPLDEQTRIEAVLLSVDEETWRSAELLNSLNETKSSLLTSLLTGQVRVSP